MHATAILNAPRHRTKLSRGLLRNEWMELGFVPELGCHWTRLRLSVKGEWFDFLKPVANGDALLDRPTGHGSYLMAPWSNRIPGGQFRFRGRVYKVRANFHDGSAIHGDARLRPWKVLRSDSSRFEALLESTAFEDFNYPFDLRFRHSIELEGHCLRMSLVIENIDDEPAPVGLGFHPFILRRLTWLDDDVILIVPAEKVYPAKGCIPVGAPIPVEGSTDLRPFKLLGAPGLDHCFTGLTENHYRIIYPGTRVEVRFEFDPAFSHAVVYAPNDSRGSAAPFVAVEPVTHANNGFNLLEDGCKNTGVRVLEPGEAWTAAWSLSAGDI